MNYTISETVENGFFGSYTFRYVSIYETAMNHLPQAMLDIYLTAL